MSTSLVASSQLEYVRQSKLEPEEAIAGNMGEQFIPALFLPKHLNQRRFLQLTF